MDSGHLIDVNDFPLDRKKVDPTKYMYRHPTIKPNLGKTRRNILPKTHVCKVLLYDNTMQRKTLSIKTQFFNHQQRSVQCMLEKTRHTFADRVRTKQRLHDVWDAKYNTMKDDYISEFGTKYMPTAAGEEEEGDYWVFKFANLAPPINVICYFLDSGNDPRQKAIAKRERASKKIENMTKDPLLQYLQRRGHPITNIRKDECHTKNSSNDWRYKKLTNSLADPGFPTDGYIQLSPGYAKGVIRPKNKVFGHSRDIELPLFYAKLRAKREGSACSLHSEGGNVRSSFIYEDDRSSVSSLV